MTYFNDGSGPDEPRSNDENGRSRPNHPKVGEGDNDGSGHVEPSGNTEYKQKLHEERQDIYARVSRSSLLKYSDSRKSSIRFFTQDFNHMLHHMSRGVPIILSNINTNDEDIDPGESVEIASDVLWSKLKSKRALNDRLSMVQTDVNRVERDSGLRTLYLSIGQLVWTESPESKIKHRAPLILVPVELIRNPRSTGFSLLKSKTEEIETNQLLAKKLFDRFKIELPDFDAQKTVTQYFDEVNQSVEDRGWSVVKEAMYLDKFMMKEMHLFEDLDLGKWDLKESEGASVAETILMGEYDGKSRFSLDGDSIKDASSGKSTQFDTQIKRDKLPLIQDADSSAIMAMYEVRSGKNLILHGPPGTGKSTTIVSIIADALLNNKKILLVSEKMTALDVPMRKLEKLGLRSGCLELHRGSLTGPDLARRCLSVLKERIEYKPISNKCGDDSSLDTAVKLSDYAKEMNVTVGETGVSISDAIRGLPIDIPQVTGIEFLSEMNEKQFYKERDLFEKYYDSLGELGNNESTRIYDAIQSTDLDPTALRELGKDLNLLSETTKNLLNTINKLSSEEKADFSGYKIWKAYFQFAKKLSALKALGLGELRYRDCFEPGVKRYLDRLLQLIKERDSLRDMYKKVPNQYWTDTNSRNAAIYCASQESAFRKVSKKYRQAKRALIDAQAMDYVDPLNEYWVISEKISSLAPLLRGKLGEIWSGSETDVDVITQCLELIQCMTALRQANPNGDRILEKMYDNILFGSHCDSATQLFGQARQLWNEIQKLISRPFRLLEVDINTFLNSISSIGDLECVFSQWASDLKKIDAKIRSNGYRQRLGKRYDPIIQMIDRSDNLSASSPADMSQLLEVLRSERIANAGFKKGGVVGRKSGELEELRKSLKESTSDYYNANIARVQSALAERAMEAYNSYTLINTLTEDAKKKRAKRTARMIFRSHLEEILEICPVIVATPTAVAQYLPKTAEIFDLVIFDEASQIMPVSALGSIMRAKQMLVVGDDKQLQPTDNFSSKSGEEYADVDDDIGNASDLTSILDFADSKGVPRIMLKFHYRSEHHSLINVSNKEFYENELRVPQSAYFDTTKLGLQFRYIDNAVYDRGQTRTNRIEAQKIAEEVADHVRSSPNLSLMVAAMSSAQRDEIVTCLEELAVNNDELRRYIEKDGIERFEVKSLEEVQGDERDVVFVSATYGPDESGKITLQLGPIIKEGGANRLNVLMTRARKVCRIFSSMKYYDLPLTDNLGVNVFKSFLQFAEEGVYNRFEVGDRDPDSQFEIEVMNALKKEGYEVHPQVGCNGYRIDLAVVDPSKLGKYLLGIECDGAMYHSHPDAQSRDRRRQEILERLGWNIHRIWSTDWFTDPKLEIKRLLKLIRQLRETGDELQEKSDELQDP